jgi:hypothetical protein
MLVKKGKCKQENNQSKCECFSLHFGERCKFETETAKAFK